MNDMVYEQILKDIEQEIGKLEMLRTFVKSKINSGQKTPTLFEIESSTKNQVISEGFALLTATRSAAIVLEECGKPMKVAEIYKKMLEKGFKWTSKNPKNSLYTSLDRKKKTFKRMGVGYFGLTKWKKEK